MSTFQKNSKCWHHLSVKLIHSTLPANSLSIPYHTSHAIVNILGVLHKTGVRGFDECGPSVSTFQNIIELLDSLIRHYHVIF